MKGTANRHFKSVVMCINHPMIEAQNIKRKLCGSCYYELRKKNVQST